MIGDMNKRLRFLWSLIANVVVASLGAAILESPLSHLFRVHGLAEILTRTFTLGILCGFLLGYFVVLLRRSPGASWVWIAGVGWPLIVSLSATSGSVLEAHHQSLWETLSGRTAERECWLDASAGCFALYWLFGRLHTQQERRSARGLVMPGRTGL